MSTSTKTLVFLWLCLYQVSGLPVAKRISASGDGDDVLAGSDFLSVFMQRSDTSRTVRPIADFNDRSYTTRNRYYSRHDYDNSVNHRNPELSQYSENYEKYNKPYNTDIDYKESNMSPELDSYKASSEAITVQDIDVKPTADAETTTALEENPTTVLDFEKTFTTNNGDKRSEIQESQENASVKNDDQITPATTETVKVISVRVSSSVVRHSSKPIAGHDSENKSTLEAGPILDKTEQQFSPQHTDEDFTAQETVREEEFITDSKENVQSQERLEAEESQQSKKTSNTHPYILTEENLVSTLVTQDEPTITAAQRNEFAVEEASAREEQTAYLDSIKPKPLTSVYRFAQQKEIPGTVEEVEQVPSEERQSNNQKLIQIGNFHNPPEALTSVLHNEPDVYSQINSQHHQASTQNKKPLTVSGEDYPPAQGLNYQVSSQPSSSPVSYHTSVSTATSDSRVQFYREPSNFNREAVAETVQRNVVAKKETIPLPHLNSQKNSEGNSNVSSGHRDARYQEKPHQEQAETNYEVAERVYGNPEQNYEVDEAVSVVTNGRTHGLQIPTPQPTRTTADSKEDKNKDSNHKFGYVVEGRNYRKYRVEERTPDGFIVGEYGVVSHDDGSLRGVRYTADSTINPRLIYDALVKFLSLK